MLKTQPLIASTRRLLLLAGVLAIATAASSQAATIMWGAPTTISANSDVSVNGTLVRALNVGNANAVSTTVNGVLFEAWAIPNGSASPVTLGNFTLAMATGNMGSAAPSSGALPFSALSSEYRALVGDEAGALDINSPLTLTMGGLTANETYEFQWWVNASSGGFTQATSGTAGNSVLLDWNNTNAAGGVGQYAIGTFVADGTSQQVTFLTAGNQAIISGFQLRQTSTVSASVPDGGSTLALLGMAFTGLGVLRRKLS